MSNPPLKKSARRIRFIHMQRISIARKRGKLLYKLLGESYGKPRLLMKRYFVKTQLCGFRHLDFCP